MHHSCMSVLTLHNHRSLCKLSTTKLHNDRKNHKCRCCHTHRRFKKRSQIRRYHLTVRAVFMGVLSTLSVDFLEFFPGNRNHHHFSDDVGCHEVQLACHCEVGCCEVEDEDEDAAGGFSQCNTDIQSFDRHSKRSFLLLRIADFVVDAVDVVDVLVSEFVPSPPGEHLAFSDIVLMQSANSCRCRRGFLVPISISNEEPNVWRFGTIQLV